MYRNGLLRHVQVLAVNMFASCEKVSPNRWNHVIMVRVRVSSWLKDCGIDEQDGNTRSLI